MRQAGDAFLEIALLGRRHEGPESEQRRHQAVAAAFVGPQHPVEHVAAVAAAAGGDQHEGFVDRRPGMVVGDRRQAARQVAGVHGLGDDRGRQIEPGQGRADARAAVHPDFVVQVLERRDRPLALPLGAQRPGTVHDVAQAEHRGGAGASHVGQGRLDLAAESQRFLVDQEQVRSVTAGGVLDDRGPHRQGIFEIDMQPERRILAVVQLDDTRDADEIDPRLEVETADDRRAGQDQDRQALVALDQRVCDGPAAAQVTEPERIVTVDQYAGSIETSGHDRLLPASNGCVVDRCRPLALRGCSPDDSFAANTRRRAKYFKRIHDPQTCRVRN